jgi:hypothetical protein
VHFVFNNLSVTNLDQKERDLIAALPEQYLPWLCQYTVLKRAAQEQNYLTLYLQFVDRLDKKLPLLIQVCMYGKAIGAISKVAPRIVRGIGEAAKVSRAIGQGARQARQIGTALNAALYISFLILSSDCINIEYSFQEGASFFSCFCNRVLPEPGYVCVCIYII